MRYRWSFTKRPRCASRHPDWRRIDAVNFLSPFSLSIYAIVALALFGLPIGYSMIVATILYLLLMGLDLSTAAEQIMNGMLNSYVLLAVPLFLFSARR